jgi:hypothetical protein
MEIPTLHAPCHRGFDIVINIDVVSVVAVGQNRFGFHVAAGLSGWGMSCGSVTRRIPVHPELVEGSLSKDALQIPT